MIVIRVHHIPHIWLTEFRRRISLLFYNIKNIALGLTISIVKDDFGDPSRVYGLTTVRVTPVTKILFCITHTSRPKTLRPSSSGTVGTRTRRNARSYCFSSNANAADCIKRACLSVSDVKRIVRSGLEKNLPPPILSLLSLSVTKRQRRLSLFFWNGAHDGYCNI